MYSFGRDFEEASLQLHAYLLLCIKWVPVPATRRFVCGEHDATHVGMILFRGEMLRAYRLSSGDEFFDSRDIDYICEIADLRDDERTYTC